MVTKIATDITTLERDMICDMICDMIREKTLLGKREWLKKQASERYLNS